MNFKSSEHAYQWCKLNYIGMHAVADEVLYCDTPRHAKLKTSAPDELLKDWHPQKMQAMHEILLAKLNCCSKFGRMLIDSGTKILIEGTTDNYWACGISGAYARTADISYMPGDNRLGSILMDIRDNLLSKSTYEKGQASAHASSSTETHKTNDHHQVTNNVITTYDDIPATTNRDQQTTANANPIPTYATDPPTKTGLKENTATNVDNHSDDPCVPTTSTATSRTDGTVPSSNTHESTVEASTSASMSTSISSYSISATTNDTSATTPTATKVSQKTTQVVELIINQSESQE